MNPEFDEKKFDSQYYGNQFTIDLYKDWKDKTIYTIAGPVSDGIQHNIIITVDYEAKYNSVVDFAEWQIKTLEDNLKGCLLLKKGNKILLNKMPAYEAIFRWYPTDKLRLYQHQIYILHETIGFQLTASFTKKTRKMFGPPVERMMLSFNPQKK
ncbi:MAG: DcrB-related protein [bacterium]